MKLVPREKSVRFIQTWDREAPLQSESALTSGLVPVHWLHTFTYCEVQLYLEKGLGIEAPPTMAMIAGAEKHAVLDEGHKERAEVELSVNEASIKAKAEEVILVSRDIHVRGSALYGRIDETVFEPGRIVIIDDKPGIHPYFTNKIQVWGYCHAFREMYQPPVPLFGALRREDTGDLVWLEEFLDDHMSLVEVTVNRIRAILNGMEKPQPAGNSRKCRPCRFNASCPAKSNVS